MYEKLARQLQYCATHDCMNEGEVKVGCNAPYEVREGVTTCNDVLMLKAADAIEELIRVADAIPHVCECCIGCEVESGGCDNAFVLSPKRAMEYLSKPRWIPVTEQLPEDGIDVLAYLKYEVGGRIAAANYDKGMWQDCVMGGLYRTEEGVVTHWMPIPQPPKEEAK